MDAVKQLDAGVCEGRAFVASWSGGKDSCLALYRAARGGGKPACLITMLDERGARSRAHAIRTAVLRAQAALLGIPIIFRRASWENYEKHFLDALKEAKGLGAEAGVFGDIDLQEHLDWVEGACGKGGVTACEPLWKGERRELLGEFLAAGFRAKIVAVKEAALGEEFLGLTLDDDVIRRIEALGADACGEKGEYHTLVVDGPLFKAPLEVADKNVVRREGYAFLDVALAK